MNSYLYNYHLSEAMHWTQLYTASCHLQPDAEAIQGFNQEKAKIKSVS
jgi:hypothetical protein